MLTPCVKPVTAGKKIANSGQKEMSTASGPGVRLTRSSPGSQAAYAPTKNEASAAARIAMMTNWNRVARSEPA